MKMELNRRQVLTIIPKAALFLGFLAACGPQDEREAVNTAFADSLRAKLGITPQTTSAAYSDNIYQLSYHVTNWMNNTRVGPIINNRGEKIFFDLDEIGEFGPSLTVPLNNFREPKFISPQPLFQQLIPIAENSFVSYYGTQGGLARVSQAMGVIAPFSGELWRNVDPDGKAKNHVLHLNFAPATTMLTYQFPQGIKPDSPIVDQRIGRSGIANVYPDGMVQVATIIINFHNIAIAGAIQGLDNRTIMTGIFANECTNVLAGMRFVQEYRRRPERGNEGVSSLLDLLLRFSNRQSDAVSAFGGLSYLKAFNFLEEEMTRSLSKN